MLAKSISHYVETASAPWKPSKIAGVEFLSLNADGGERQGSILFKLGRGATYPRHRHPGGEEILMLKGEMTVGDRKLKSGDYLYSPPGSLHEMKSETGAFFLSILPKPVAFVAGGPTEDIEAAPEPPVALTDAIE